MPSFVYHMRSDNVSDNQVHSCIVDSFVKIWLKNFSGFLGGVKNSHNVKCAHKKIKSFSYHIKCGIKFSKIKNNFYEKNYISRTWDKFVSKVCKFSLLARNFIHVLNKFYSIVSF